MTGKLSVLLWVTLIILVLVSLAAFLMLFGFLPNPAQPDGQLKGETATAQDVSTNEFAAKASPEGEMAAEELLQLTWEAPEVRTNLSTGNLVLLQLAFQTDNKETVEELASRSFQVKDAQIKILQDLTRDDLLRQDGLLTLLLTIKEEVNMFLQQGQVEKVFVLQKIVQ